jgi:hypothetical protein
MAAVKKFNSNLLIQSTGTSANITLDAETLFVDAADAFITGNLHVAGVYDTTTVTNTNIQDKDIALNVGETNYGVGGNVSPGSSGIIIDRGLQANVSLRWNEIFENWEITTDGTNYGNILTAGSGGITAVVEDTSPDLGGNLTTNGFHLQFDTPTINPPTPPGGPVIGITLLYGANVGSAGSGLFVINTETTSDELVTKSKAIVFSIIL